MVALKAVDALEDIHNCGYVHKDIKPDNIAISLDPADPTIYLLDLGLSSRYSHAGIHTAYSETEEFVGSPFFASINSIRGVKPSRRDDLESLGYVLLFLLHGNLPWFQAAAASTANLLRQVLKIREKYPIKSLCPPEEAELGDYLDYCQGLGFSDKPNYEGVRQYFWAWRDRIDAEVDWVYDWTPRRKEKIKGKAKTTNSPKVRKDKRRLTSSRISPSKNMTVLETHSPVVSPGLKIKALQHFSIQLQNPILNISSSSGERSPDSVKTPVHGIEQLPSFTSRSRKLFPLRTQKDHGPSTTSLPEPPDHSKQRRFTCDESSFSQEETESP